MRLFRHKEGLKAKTELGQPLVTPYVTTLSACTFFAPPILLRIHIARALHHVLNANESTAAEGRLVGAPVASRVRWRTGYFPPRTDPLVMKALSSSTVELSDDFVKLAERFGMVPRLLAERVLASFVRERPRELLIKAASERASAAR